MTASTSARRERRRAETVQEILEAAEQQLTAVGAQALSLRAVARQVGMSAQAIYHYFESRDDLITALIAAAHDDLADSVESAREANRHLGRDERLLAVTRAYREWAVANPTRFGLAYGMPMSQYVAPPGGPTTIGPRRMGEMFASTMFDDWTPGELDSVTLPDVPVGLYPSLQAAAGSTSGLPPAAAALFLVAWGRMHGMVGLEVFGHLDWTAGASADLFDAAMRLLVEDLRRLRSTAAATYEMPPT